MPLRLQTKPARVAVRIAVLLAVSCVLVIFLEGLGSVVLGWKAAKQQVFFKERLHCDYDPDLGWMHIPDFRVEDAYGAGVHLQTNGQRFRDVHDYERAVPDGVFRVVCLGDSFTMGYGVGDAESYPALMEAAVPGLECVNMGMGGFGVGQCYLWYMRDGLEFETDVLLLAVIGGDFLRMVPGGNVANAVKPYLAQDESGALYSRNAPVGNAMNETRTADALTLLWYRSAFYRFLVKPWHTPRQVRLLEDGKLVFEPLARRVLEDLRDVSAERGQTFAVVYLPEKGELARGSGLFADWMVPTLKELGIPMFDLMEEFGRLTPAERNTHYLPDGHFTILGNRLAAEAILKRLAQLDPDLPAR